MNLWKTLGLLLVFGLLFAYVRVYEKGDAPDHEADRMLVEQMGFKSPDDITEVQVECPDGGFTLEREPAADGQQGQAVDAATWKLTKPLEAKTEATTAGNFVKTLLTTKADRSYNAETAAKLSDEDSGLNTPSRTLTLKDRSGKTVTMVFGNAAPNDAGYYARLKDSQGLLIFTKYYVDENLAQKKVGDLRSKDLLSFASADAKTLALKYPAETIDLEQKGDDWVIKGDRELAADGGAVMGILSALSSARVEEFVDSAGSDLAEYGLDKPRIEVTVGLGTAGQNGLLIGSTKEPDFEEQDPNQPAPPESKVYVKRTGDSEVMLVNANLYDSCLKDRTDLRDKTIVKLDQPDVTRLAYTVGGKSVELVKEPAKKAEQQATWQLKQPADLPADEKVVSGLLSTIDLLRATAFVDAPGDLAQYGLAKPQGRIEVRQGKDENLPAILLGKEATDHTGLYVMRDGGKLVYKVRASFADDLETDPNRLRDLLVMEVDRTKVKEISLRQANGDLVVLTATGANEWQVTKPEEQEADSGRVGAVLTSLEAVRGNEYVTDKADDLKPYGLDKPAVTATITLDDGSKQTLYLGEDPKGGLGVYLKAQGKDAIFRSDSGLILTDLQKKPDDFKPFEEPMQQPPMF